MQQTKDINELYVNLPKNPCLKDIQVHYDIYDTKS